MELDERGSSVAVSHAPGGDAEAVVNGSTEARPAHRVDWLLMVALVVALVLRFFRLGHEPLWYDEFVTAQNVAAPLGRVFAVSRHVEGTPPLFVYLEWFWVHLFGRGDGALRSLSAVVGVGTVAVSYAFVRELGRSRRIAGIAALLVATNPMLVWYSREARAYGLLVLIGTISLWFAARAVNRGRTLDFVWWGAAATLAMCTHYFAVVILVPEFVWIGWSRRAEWKRLAIGCILPAVAAVPLAALAVSQEGDRQAWINDFALTMRLGEAARQAASGPGKALDLWWLGLAALVVAAVLVALRGTRQEQRTAWTMVLIAVGGVALGATVGVNFFLGRNVIVALVPLFVAIAIGFGTRRAGLVGVASVVIVCVLWSAAVVRQATDTQYQKPDWDTVAAHFAEGGPGRAIVVPNYLGAPITQYATKHGHFDELHGDDSTDVRTIDLAYHVAPPSFRCGRWSGLQCEVFWFPSFPESLASKFVLVDKIAYGGFVVNRYRSSTPVRVDRDSLLGSNPEAGAYVLVAR
jgi:predicted membrane-bound mannosyltransferase